MRWTAAERRRLRHLREAKHQSYSECACALGRTRSQISSACRRFGIGGRHQPLRDLERPIQRANFELGRKVGPLIKEAAEARGIRQTRLVQELVRQVVLRGDIDTYLGSAPDGQ